MYLQWKTVIKNTVSAETEVMSITPIMLAPVAPMSQGNMSQKEEARCCISTCMRAHTHTHQGIVSLEYTQSLTSNNFLWSVSWDHYKSHVFRCASWEACFWKLCGYITPTCSHTQTHAYAHQCMRGKWQRGMCNCHISLFNIPEWSCCRWAGRQKKSLTLQTQSTVVCGYGWVCVSAKGGVVCVYDVGWGGWGEVKERQ